jgi:hypothetical protein
MLRAAIDASPILAQKVKTDPDIQALKSRPELQTIMNILADVGGPTL